MFLAQAKDMSSVPTAQLAEIINTSYAKAEAPFWSSEYRRTTEEQVSADAQRGALYLWCTEHAEAVKTTSASEAQPRQTVQAVLAGRAVEVVGTVSLRLDEEAKRAMLSQLVVLPAHRRRGHARAILGATDRWARDRGATSVQLELLLPPSGPHPKDALATFYTSVGFVRQPNAVPLDALYPSLVPSLAPHQAPILVVFVKSLLVHGGTAA
mmetsp:Transcript_15846/g.49569  ORF Transcript_15846/g.49569 Transcript_15846/m.49569 type:complete len:211 (-) Transcript_15846:827-1459(-)